MCLISTSFYLTYWCWYQWVVYYWKLSKKVSWNLEQLKVEQSHTGWVQDRRTPAPIILPVRYKQALPRVTAQVPVWPTHFWQYLSLENFLHANRQPTFIIVKIFVLFQYFMIAAIYYFVSTQDRFLNTAILLSMAIKKRLKKFLFRQKVLDNWLHYLFASLKLYWLES